MKEVKEDTIRWSDIVRRENVCLQCGRPEFNPWVGKISWRRKWQPTPVFLPGKCHGQRSLVGYSPWGRKESDTTEWLSDFSFFHTHTHTHTHNVLGLEESILWKWLYNPKQVTDSMKSLSNYQWHFSLIRRKNFTFSTKTWKTPK